MYKSFAQLLKILTPRERKQAGFLLFMILIMAIFDLVGVVSIMPFMALLANPTIVQTNIFFSFIYSKCILLGLAANIHEFFLVVGGGVFVALILSQIFKALTTYMQLRFSMMREYSLARRLLTGYLNQSYSWYLNRSSADLTKNVLSEVTSVIEGGVIPALNCIAQMFIIILIAFVLILVNPILALSVVLVLGAAYFFIYKIAAKFTLNIGAERFFYNKKRYLTVNDAFGAYKEMKVAGLENVYIRNFDAYAKTYAGYQASEQVLRYVPRFALEAVAFGGMLLVVLYLISDGAGFTDALPVISLYAFAGYKLMPALQQVYGSIIQLRFVSHSLDFLCNELDKIETTQLSKKTLWNGPISKVALSNVFYKYPNAKNNTLSGINLSINCGAMIGLVGATGSGKTTTVDLLIGLLTPDAGHLVVDDQIVSDLNISSWRSNIGYVPQQIFLIEDSVSANIAFCIDNEEIDRNRVELASKIANLHDFVTADLENGYETKIGENGVRLSGGQRQRVGIARALYRNTRIIVLDESTSALDPITESKVMNGLKKICKDSIIIVIAHRMNTVRDCDKIFMFDKGGISASGTYQELFETNAKFRQMVNVT
jgi:ABC-type multidrug transport system fused ATPase/permease subunit